ncbi:hypothetical protein BKK53_11475 [Rodentibacter trehalosifermentans]|nr:hypothetical protein BKK53_11475 [Rodentibacter trehalosifermentans]
MKNHFNFIIFSTLLLTSCYPCRFLDWNCNQSIANTESYKKSIKCEETQKKLAREKLSNRYTEDIDLYIVNKCILSDGKYKFEADTKY